MHEVLVYRLGGLSLPRKSVFRLTDRPDMALDVYRGRKNNNTTTTTTIQFHIGTLVYYTDFSALTGREETSVCHGINPFYRELNYLRMIYIFG